MIIGFLPSCKHDVPQPALDPCDPSTVSFEKQVLPILISNCAMNGCHNSASASHGVILVSYQSVMASGIVSPGDPGESDLYEVLVETDPYGRMPPNGSLSNQEIQLIQTWIAQGAQNLNCDNGDCDTTNVTWSGTIRQLIQTNCQGCHTSASPSGGVVLDSYSAVSNSAFNGSLLGSIQHSPGWTPMPFGGSKLAECDIAKIRIWVNAGAPNN